MIISNLPPFQRNITCAVTGHREISLDLDYEKLKKDLLNINKKGYSVFLVGMATGFDLLCFKALLDCKKENENIKICAVIPCLNQEKYYSLQERKEYYEFLEKVDYIAKEEKEYYRGCMLKRNDYMLENCSLLYAYYRETGRGGTLYTVNGAKKRNIPILRYGEKI